MNVSVLSGNILSKVGKILGYMIKLSSIQWA